MTAQLQDLQGLFPAGTWRDLPCHTVEPDTFFAETPAEVEFAKALCTDCPIRAECLAGAIERAEPWGVWGGELFIGGVIVARKRPRGRPRKHPRPEEEGVEWVGLDVHPAGASRG